MSYKYKESNPVVYGGIGFFEALALIFIVLKLTGTITWSWWWVLAPIWIPFALATIFILIIFIACGIAALINRGD